MLYEHLGRGPRVDPSAVVAPTAVVSGDVTIGPGCQILHGAVITAEGGPITIGARSEVRINAVVHLRTVLPEGSTVPIAWVAVGDPAEILSPDRHEEIWAIQQGLDFPGYVFGLDRATPDLMVQLTERYARHLARHADDR